MTVTDGPTSVQAALDECTPTSPPTTAADDGAAADDHDHDHQRPPRRPPPTTTTTTTPPRPRRPPRRHAADDHDHDHDHDHDDDPPTTTTTTTTTTVPPTPVTFTELHDPVPQRCFSAPLGAVDVASVRDRDRVRLQPGELAEQGVYRGDHSFNPRSVSDTFTVTVTAPPGRHLTHVHYQQSGTGCSNGVPTGPQRHRSVDGQRRQRPVQLHVAEPDQDHRPHWSERGKRDDHGLDLDGGWTQRQRTPRHQPAGVGEHLRGECRDQCRVRRLPSHPRADFTSH